jgi:threonine dehydratase
LLAGSLPELAGKKVVLPLCGGNIDTTMIGRVIERGLAADHRLSRITAVISDRPGGLSRFANTVAQAGGNILEIEHDRAFLADDFSSVRVQCLMETRDQAHLQSVLEKLNTEGFFARDAGADGTG